MLAPLPGVHSSLSKLLLFKIIPNLTSSVKTFYIYPIRNPLSSFKSSIVLCLYFSQGTYLFALLLFFYVLFFSPDCKFFESPDYFISLYFTHGQCSTTSAEFNWMDNWSQGWGSSPRSSHFSVTEPDSICEISSSNVWVLPSNPEQILVQLPGPVPTLQGWWQPAWGWLELRWHMPITSTLALSLLWWVFPSPILLGFSVLNI